MSIIILDSKHITLSIHLAQKYKSLMSGIYHTKPLYNQPFEQAQLVSYLPKCGSVIKTLDGIEKVINKAPPGFALEQQYLISSKRYIKKPDADNGIENDNRWLSGGYMKELIIAASFVLGSKCRYHLKSGSRVKFWGSKNALALALHAQKKIQIF